MPLAPLLPPYLFLCLHFGSVPGDALVAATLHTSLALTLQVLKSVGTAWLAAWLAFVVVYAILAWRLDPERRLDGRSRRRLLAVTLTIAMLSLVVRQVLPQQLSLPALFEEQTVALTFPNNLVRSVQRVQREHEATLRTVSLQGRPAAGTASQPLLVVFVIGESVRPDHMSLFGYGRDTTPALRGLASELISYTDVASTAHYTEHAVRNLITLPVGDRRATLIRTLSEAGYRTGWFSNQERSYFSENADLSDHAKSDYDFHLRSDQVLIAPMQSMLRQAGDRQFIVLHTIGSHFPYEERYGADAARFRPTLADAGINRLPGPQFKAEAINSYDNTLLELDKLLAQVVATLRTERRPALLIFTSDHGENLFDDSRHLFMHALHQPSSWDTRVPLLFWANDAFKATHPEAITQLRAKAQRHVGHRDLFPTLLDLARVEWQGQRTSESLIRPEWTERARTIQSLDGHDRDHDEMRQAEQSAAASAPK